MAEHFDPDPELGAALRARSGGEVAVDDAFDAVLSRSATVRRRRMATTTLAVSVLAIGGFALLPRGGERTIAPADEVPAVEDPDPSAPAGERDDDATTTTIAVDEDALSIAPTDGPAPSSPDDDADEDDPPSGSGPVSTPVSTVATGDDDDPGVSTTVVPAAPAPTTTTMPPSTTTTTASTSPSTTAPTAAPIAPFTKTYQSTGGSITVNWNGSALSLQAVTPAAGFDAEIENEEPMRIRVRFRGTDDDARIQVRIDDGQLLEEIS